MEDETLLQKVITFISVLLLLGLSGCQQFEGKYELTIYQGFYFNEGQSYVLILDDGAYSRKKSFKRRYWKNKRKKLVTYRTDNDSIKVYFKLDQQDTSFIMPSDYTSRIAVASSAYGHLKIATDHEPWAGKLNRAPAERSL